MGGRGSKSGFTTPKARRGQLESYINSKTAEKMLQDETGFGDDQTEEVFDLMTEYFGGDYHAFTSGKEEAQTKKIDSALARMGAYDGAIYRGISIDTEDILGVNFNALYNISQDDIKDTLMDMYKPGEIVNIARNPGTLSSWSSERDVATRFSNTTYLSGTSVLFTCKKNKTSVGVQHISEFGSVEAEVLAPSTAQWKIKSVKVTDKDKFLGFTPSSSTKGFVVEVDVEEV